jgi:acetylornithine deacetylase
MNSTKVIDILRTLVAFDTTSRNSNLELVHWVAEFLQQAGARLRLTHDETGAKANLLASLGPERPGGILLSAHTDVVPVDGQRWSTSPFRLTLLDDRLYGRGTADMKGFIAVCLAAAAGWVDPRLNRPVHLALTHDEETGALGVPRLIADMKTHMPLPSLAIVGEPTGMRFADRHRGYLGFRSVFRGRTAHSSDPSQGVNAITAAARFAVLFDKPEIFRAAGTDSTTANVGLISGGTSLNSVPASCEVLWEMRPAADADAFAERRRLHALADQAAWPGLSFETHEIITVPGLRPDRNNRAVDLVRALGIEAASEGLPYGTEAGFFQAAGIPAVVCGPGSIDQAHQADEWICHSQLERASQFLECVTGWAAQSPSQQPNARRTSCQDRSSI